MSILRSLNRFKPSRSQLIGGAIILSTGALAWAVPNVFTSGTTISASQMNANFTDVEAQVANVQTQVTTLQGQVASPNITGNVTLVPSTPTAGNILKGADRFLHNFGTDNTFLGVNAGNFTLTGSSNTASGTGALFFNTTGNNNTASGARALLNNTAGSRNTASGAGALFNNNIGTDNTANGERALFMNTTGINNTANGAGALLNNTTGGANTASGTTALFSNTTGISNTANGAGALFINTTGNYNTANGAGALRNNTTGSNNIANGFQALASNTVGNNNIATGFQALYSNTTGIGNIALGLGAGFNLTTGHNNIAIGNSGVAGEGNTIRIGDADQTRAFIAGIRGVTTATAAIPVLVGTDGQLGTVSSSKRVKDDIADMGEASGVLMKLRPVTFHYKTDKNLKGRSLQYGLIAEEVNEIAPSLVARNAQGEIETVYYQHLVPMLLNEYQKQQRVIAAQTAELKLHKAELARQTARVAALEQQAQEIVALKRELAHTTAALSRFEQTYSYRVGVHR